MNHSVTARPKLFASLRIPTLLALALSLAACADRPSPDATGARPNEPPYPVLLIDDADRREAALANWTKITTEQGITNAPAPVLQPVTGTIRSLPSLGAVTLHIPKLGAEAILSEEQIRDSLRRFIMKAANLLGAEPQQLSLVQRTNLADGTMAAHYEQRPFRYSLRGDYGSLDITFAPDRRILQITSTCIPDSEALQRAGAGIRPRWPSNEVPKRVLGRTFTYADASGAGQTLVVGQKETVTVRELVIYPVPRSSDPTVLEFHLCWEISIGNASDSVLLYLDAVTDELIATRRANS